MGVWYSNGQVTWLGGPFKYQTFWTIKRFFSLPPYFSNSMHDVTQVLPFHAECLFKNNTCTTTFFHVGVNSRKLYTFLDYSMYFIFEIKLTSIVWVHLDPWSFSFSFFLSFLFLLTTNTFYNSHLKDLPVNKTEYFYVH